MKSPFAPRLLRPVACAALGLLLLVTAFAAAANPPAPPPAPPPPPLSAAPGAVVALSVADLDRQLAWYRDTLGFTLFSHGTAPNVTLRFALLTRGPSLVELLQFPDAKPLAAAAPGVAVHQLHGFFKGGFVVADLDAHFRALQARGVAFEFEIVRPPNGPYRTFGLRDPEGNLLQFFGP
ncbi:MAG: VOC family protein [Opitutae bacterium]|nr:VOC family protein [Opitutae bacterium]